MLTSRTASREGQRFGGCPWLLARGRRHLIPGAFIGQVEQVRVRALVAKSTSHHGIEGDPRELAVAVAHLWVPLHPPRQCAGGFVVPSARWP